MHNELIEIIEFLKKSQNLVGLKSEFEAEGATLEETLFLKKIADDFDLPLTVKIGGCEAIRDLKDLKKLQVQKIVAPMIETPYALQKFIQAVDSTYGNTKTELYINIETITGFKNLDKILSTSQADAIKGIVFGRSDMSASLGLNPDEINSDSMLFYAQKIAQACEKFEKELIIGGRITANATDFLNKIEFDSFKKFETRKMIFDKTILKNQDLKEIINKALTFELLWLKNRENINYSDEKRIKILEKSL